MNIPPPYQITHTILSLVGQIESNRKAYESFSLSAQQISNLTHLSLLKSSVYSAQIEGNTLTVSEMETDSLEGDEKQFERQEIENIITSLTIMRENKIPEFIDVQYILDLHKQVMHKLFHASQTGILRNQPSAIFDQYGNVVYMTPPPSELPSLLDGLLDLINNTPNIYPLVLAPIVHLTFEKIHPFMDGNGRVGRLLTQALLMKHGYHFNSLISLEEGIQEKKQTYYSLLDRADATDFIEFMLTVLLDQTERIKKNVEGHSTPHPEDSLTLRRQEIFAIIKDQPFVSFDQIHRRFMKIPDRTLRYDLQQLEKRGFIRKVGTTKGVVYKAKEIHNNTRY